MFIRWLLINLNFKELTRGEMTIIDDTYKCTRKLALKAIIGLKSLIVH